MKFRWEETFITDTEADYLVKLLQDYPIGSIGWSIYEECRKQYALEWHGKRVQKQEDIFVNTDQSDFLAELLQDERIGSIGNNIYEKCRKRAFGQRGFLSNQWRP